MSFAITAEMVEKAARAADLESRAWGVETYQLPPYRGFEELREETQDEWRAIIRAALAAALETA